MTRNFIYIILCLLYFSCESVKEKDPRPNILLLVADDLGYSDIGAYGGDIETPNLDQLSTTGLRFSRYHSSPLCAPSRAMLLSGNDNHIAGVGIQGERTEDFGYEGHISNRVALIPELLNDAGYHTYIAGKWHLGGSEDTNPNSRGFERSFVNVSSSGNHYNDKGMFKSRPTSNYTEDGNSANWKEGSYSTDFFTDKLIEYIEGDRGDDKPFFAYGAYTSPHWPLQVDEKYWKKYEGQYDEGYEVLRSRRLLSLKEEGLIPDDAILPPLHQRVIPWDSLSLEQKKIESRKMELYAGMVDNLDYNIGRLLDYLKEVGQFDNTLIIFLSDNGAAAEDFYYHPKYGPFLQENYSDSYKDMGTASSFVSYGPQWAEASSAPFRYFKGYTTEGGLLANMIASGPSVLPSGAIYDGFATLQDIAPTFYEIAGVVYPSSYNDHEIEPLKGRSMKSLFNGSAEDIHTDNDVFVMEHAGHALLRKGDWKLVNSELPLNKDKFGLFNMQVDLAELYDLKEVYPEIFADLLNEWDNYVRNSKVLVPSPVIFD